MDQNGSEKARDYVTWKECFSVAHPELDAQHQFIFKLLNDLHQAIETGNSDKPIEDYFEEVCHYADMHFATEETLMKRHGYPHLGGHCQFHRQFVARVEQIRQSTQGDLSYEMFCLLKDWWLNHVTQVDRDYAPYLAKQNNAAPPS
jgi:hemerythrin